MTRMQFVCIAILVSILGGISCRVVLRAQNEQSGCCAYCQNTISKHSDMVICTDGRRYHAECYMRYIEEGENGKANSETP